MDSLTAGHGLPSCGLNDHNGIGPTKQDMAPSSVARLGSGYVPQPFVALGTDGFGRSDTREALRRFFEVDRYHIVLAALHSLQPRVSTAAVASAIARYDIDVDVAAPWMR